MRANEFITEQSVTTTNAQGVTTTVNKAANRVTTKDAGGTVVKDRSGNMRSIATPKIGGFQAKQTFRPDATPGYQQATYTKGPTTLDIKGSPETGFTKSAKFSAGGMDVKQTQRYSGQKQTDASLNLGKGKTFKATLTQSQFEDVQAAIREHVAKRVPFTECMFRPGSAAFTEFYRQVRECADKLNLDWEDQELIATDIGECIMVEGEMVALDVPMIEEEELDEAQFDTTGLELVKKQDGIELWKSLTDPNEVVAKLPADEMSSNTVWDGYWDGSQWEFESRSGRHGVFYIDQLDELFESLKEAEYQGRKVKLNSPKRGGPKKFYVYTKNKKGNVIKVSWGDTTGLSVKAKDRGAVKSFVARHKCKEKNDKTKAGYWACRTPRYKSLGVKGGQWW
jgi:hypothetical protein